MPEAHPSPPARAYTPTALPPVAARVLAFVAIIVAGVCGGLIAYSITNLQCGSDDGRAATVLPAAPPGERPSAATGELPADDGCTTIAGLGGLLGAIVSAAGVAVIVVLVLRAMAEWRRAPSP